MHSRTNLRLQLQREQSIQEYTRGSSSSITTTPNENSMEVTNVADSSSLAGTSQTMPINSGVRRNSKGGKDPPKSLPVLISQPIRFNGNRLVHLPPQIIHVQQGSTNNNNKNNAASESRQDYSGSGSSPRKQISLGGPTAANPKMCTMTLSSSLPHQSSLLNGSKFFNPNSIIKATTQGGPSGDFRNQTTRLSSPPHFGFPINQQGRSASKQSFAELSPSGTGGYVDSPCASFASAQSELDDVIIDEILSMQEEQQHRNFNSAAATAHSLSSSLQHASTGGDMRRSLQHKLVSSLSYADNLEGLLTLGVRNNSLDEASPSSSSTASHNHHHQHHQYSAAQPAAASHLLQTRQVVSSSAPSTASVDIERLVREEGGREQDLMRERRKKDVHNMIERRRRYNINDRIKDLGTLLPKSCTEEMKLNKGTILQASVEYILELRKDRQKLIQIYQKQQVLEDENRRLLGRIRELETLLRSSGLVVPSPYEPATYSRSGGATSSSFDTSRIKTEPLDDELSPIASAAGSGGMERSASQTPSTSSELERIVYGYTTTNNNNQQQVPAPAQYYETVSNSSPVSTYHHHNNNGSGGSGQSSHHNPHNQSSSSHNYAATGATGATPSDDRHLMHMTSSSSSSLMNPNLHDFMMELASENHHHHGLVDVAGPLLSTAACLSSHLDPMMSDSRLINSQVSSPDVVHWDSAAFSPDRSNERMDYATSA